MTKPIKRHPAIAELSRDHHFALLLVWKIREGIKKSVDKERIKRYIVHFFETELQPHFSDEEKFLFSKISKENKLRIQAEAEHNALRKLIGAMRKESSGTDVIQEFAGVLEKHIRFEERELFNYLQDNLSENDLSEVASTLSSREHQSDNEWSDVFWEKKVSVK